MDGMPPLSLSILLLLLSLLHIADCSRIEGLCHAIVPIVVHLVLLALLMLFLMALVLLVVVLCLVFMAGLLAAVMPALIAL